MAKARFSDSRRVKRALVQTPPAVNKLINLGREGRGTHHVMIWKFLTDEKGLELSEYAVAAALVAITAVMAFHSLGTAIGDRLETLVSRVNG